MNVAGKTGGNMQLDSFQGEPHEFRWLKTFYNVCPQKVQKLVYFYYEKSLRNRLLGILLREVAIERLRRASTKCKSIDDYIALAFSFKLGPFDIKPVQIEWEISKLMQILAKLKPKAALEIGTEGGGTFFLLTKVASPDATLISVDLPRGPFGGRYSKWKIPFYRSFGSANQKIHLLRADSHNKTTTR